MGKKSLPFLSWIPSGGSAADCDGGFGEHGSEWRSGVRSAALSYETIPYLVEWREHDITDPPTPPSFSDGSQVYSPRNRHGNRPRGRTWGSVGDGTAAVAGGGLAPG